jgi:two-component system copper resistance phosphate regulon response regulator CusR
MSQSAYILIVDDQLDTLALLELTLQSAGFRVQTASSGEMAMGHLREDSFDAILLDIMMPDMNGFELVDRLAEQAIACPPIVFLTARASVDDRQKGEELGAIAYLTKPATRGQLIDAVNLALEARE